MHLKRKGKSTEELLRDNPELKCAYLSDPVIKFPQGLMTAEQANAIMYAEVKRAGKAVVSHFKGFSWELGATVVMSPEDFERVWAID
jgi:hypothetical protein